MPKLKATVLGLLFAAGAVAAQDMQVAGVSPAERPDGAPEVKEVQKDGEWYQRALHGVSRPYPYSLRFLEDQGNWFTPFTHPGMADRYDIRGWN